MRFFKLTFGQIPKMVFAHQFSTYQYDFKVKTGHLIEITYIDSGGLTRTICGETSVLGAGDFLISPPETDLHIALRPPGEFHSHSTIAFSCEAEAEFCTAQELLACKYVHQDQNTPDEYKNFFVFPLQFREEGHILQDILKDIINHSKQQTISNSMLLSGYFLELCYLLTQKSLEIAERGFEGYIPPSNMLYCKRILDYVADHYQTDISLEMLSGLVGLNKNYMCGIFKKTMKQSIVHYLIRYRINKAKELMTATSVSIAEVARQVGIENEAYFSRLFNKYEGMSPAKFRAHCLRGILYDTAEHGMQAFQLKANT